jgi:hypothetical protein
MNFFRTLGLLVVVLLLVPFAYADGSPANMVFVGVNGANDGHYYVSPYNGTMNGQNVMLFCVDIKNEVNFGETWTANVTNLGTALGTINGFSNTRYGGVPSSPVFSTAPVDYQEAAWLTTQFASHPGDYVSLQYALWDLMNPGSEPTTYGDVAWWLNQAGLNYSSINPNNFEIVTNTGNLALTGQVQEFLVQTPEPSTMALLLCGLLAMIGITVARTRLTA